MMGCVKPPQPFCSVDDTIIEFVLYAKTHPSHEKMWHISYEIRAGYKEPPRKTVKKIYLKKHKKILFETDNLE